MTNDNDRIDVSMAMLRGMKDQFKRDQVNFECNKENDYSYRIDHHLVRAPK